jgi:chaperonin GroES
MKVTPLADRVLIKPLEASEEKKGGIIIPDTAKEKPQQGEVKAIGPGPDKDTPMTVKVGNTVLYAKYGGTEVRVDDEDLMIMSESDILAIIEK